MGLAIHDKPRWLGPGAEGSVQNTLFWLVEHEGVVNCPNAALNVGGSMPGIGSPGGGAPDITQSGPDIDPYGAITQLGQHVNKIPPSSFLVMGSTRMQALRVPQRIELQKWTAF